MGPEGPARLALICALPWLRAPSWHFPQHSPCCKPQGAGSACLHLALPRSPPTQGAPLAREPRLDSPPPEPQQSLRGHKRGCWGLGQALALTWPQDTRLFPTSRDRALPVAVTMEQLGLGRGCWTLALGPPVGSQGSVGTSSAHPGVHQKPPLNLQQGGQVRAGQGRSPTRDGLSLGGAQCLRPAPRDPEKRPSFSRTWDLRRRLTWGTSPSTETRSPL